MPSTKLIYPSVIPSISIEFLVHRAFGLRAQYLNDLTCAYLNDSSAQHHFPHAHWYVIVRMMLSATVLKPAPLYPNRSSEGV